MALSNEVYPEVYTKVTKVLVQSLGVEEDDIKPSATLQADLGAESIDFLDIVFRLERECGIKIPRGELFSERVFELSTKIVQDGHVTAEGLAALRSQMPYADLTTLERDRRLNGIDDLFTVDQVRRVEALRDRRSPIRCSRPVPQSFPRGADNIRAQCRCGLLTQWQHGGRSK
jgi:acyl carrier protein